MVHFRPWIMKIDVVLATTGRKEWSNTTREKAGLQEKTFAGLLRIARHAYVIGIGKRFYRIEHVFDLDIRQLSSADALLDFIGQCFLARFRRFIVVSQLTIDR